jgi:hypothetical protein
MSEEISTVPKDRFDNLMKRNAELKNQLDELNAKINDYNELSKRNEANERLIKEMTLNSANKDLAHEFNARSTKSLFAELEPLDSDDIDIKQYIKERKKQIKELKENENYNWLFNDEPKPPQINGVVPAEPIRSETNELSFNPFAKQTLDLDLCTQLYRTDPERAKKLASEAGVNI